MDTYTDQAQEDKWQDRGFSAVQKFAVALRDLHRTNPWPDIALLPQAMSYLMTELWDEGFTQTQIREAFNAALTELPRYTAGEEGRS